MSFSKKAAQIMHTLQTDYGEFRVPISKKDNKKEPTQDKTCKHSCSAVQVKITPVNQQRKSTRDTLLLQNPVIIEKRTHAKCTSAHRAITQRRSNSTKKVEPFVPISIPSRQRNKLNLQTTTMETTSRNKQIEIILDDDSQDKQCLKKLFRKIHNLTAELAESQKERIRLKLQLDHISKRDISCRQHEKIINKLEGEKFKMEAEIQMLKKNAKDNSKISPKETIREIVVERPIQVKVQVPKYIPGPERIIQKIVQVPKYVQIQKKIPEIIVKEIKVPEIIEKTVYVDKPIYKDPIIVDKPVFVDKPIYIDRPVQVQKRVEVEVPFQVQVPVYIEKPFIDEEWLRRFQQIEEQLGVMMRENQVLKSENFNLKTTIGKLQANLQLLNTHNRDKNRQIQHLLSNRGDYLPPRFEQQRLQRKQSALDRTSQTLSPRNHSRRYF